MDIDNARKKLNISGYVHPETVNTGVIGNNRYKTFTEGGKKVKSMDKFKSVDTGNPYAVHNSENIDSCPICKESAVDVCYCAYSDKMCKNNHRWYTDRSGKDKIGDPHKLK